MKTLTMPPALALAASVLALSVGAAPAQATPPGYRVVESGALTAHPGVQTRGTVRCPAGTVTWGGGVILGTPHAGTTISGSYPMARGAGWVAVVNDVGGSDGTFVVQAVCAQAPATYRVIKSAAIAVAPGTQGSGVQSCPGRTAVLGGGIRSGASSVAAFANSSFPEADVNGWVARQNDTGRLGSSFNVYAICGRAPSGYTVATGPVVAVPPSAEVSSSVVCPVGHPLSGGVTALSSSVGLALTTSDADQGGWTVLEDNGGGDQDARLIAFVICA
jgi:hypothetical protein